MEVKTNYILTDVVPDVDFFSHYMDQMAWENINELYGDHKEYTDAMTDELPVEQYVKHISDYDMSLKKFLIKTFKRWGIKTQDFRCDFFLTKPGGSLPPHVDHKSKIAMLFPLAENTGVLKVDSCPDVVYNKMLILNTQVEHQVCSPEKDRLLFRIAIHDFAFEDISYD